MKLTDAQQQALADRLFESVRAGQGIDPPSNTLDYDFDDAYRVRRKLVDHLIAAGGRPKGHKIGFTSEAMQKMYGMTGPDFGILLDNMFTPQDQPVRVSHLSNTRAEPELAFELSRPLEGKVTIEDVLAATARIWAAVEVIDSRVGAMKAKANDSLADNAGAGWVVLGSKPLTPEELDVTTLTLSMEVDGVAQSAPATDVMHHPAAPLAFLAGKLAELEGLGGHLKAGDIVITGAPVRSVEVKAGSKLHADFGPLGTIDLSFE
ncbi:MAG: fumarylacetoacetate hydrolase family protein [Paracoccaceae bacterium]